MSRNRKKKNKPNSHENCLSNSAKKTSREIAIELLKECKKREAKLVHEKIQIDSKTYKLHAIR